MKSAIIAVLLAAGSALGKGPTIINWNNAAGGSWNTATNWSPNTVPNSANHFPVISLKGDYTINVPGNFITGGMDLLNTDATITISNAGSLIFAGNVLNDGEIIVNTTAGGNSTHLQFNGSLTLDGTGRVVLNAHPSNLGTGLIHNTSGVLTHALDHTITGRGRISSTMTNFGTVDANGAGMTIELNGGAKTNHGVMSATDGGSLNINTGVMQDPLGEILANNGTVRTFSVTITDGIIRAVNDGVFTVDPGNATTLNGVTSSGPFAVPNSSVLSIVTNDWQHDGTVTVNTTAAGNDTRVQFNNVENMTGACTFVLNAHPGNFNTGYISTVAGTTTFGPDVLITGRGRVHASMVNDGTILATGTEGSIELLSAAKTNNGLIAANSAGTITINSAISQSPLGLISASQPGSTVVTGSVTITGGQVSASKGGVVSVSAGNTTTLNGVTSDGDFHLPNASVLNVVTAPWEHDGVVTVNTTAAGNDTHVQFNDVSDVTGFCTFLLNAHPGNLSTSYLSTVAGTTTFGPDVLVTGRGRVFGSFINNGTCDAAGEGNTIELLSSPKTNNNLMMASDTGVLAINAHITQHPLGVIRADNATVSIGSVSITDGIIEAINGGGVTVAPGNTTTLDSIVSSGPMQVPNSSVLNVISNNWTHQGTVTINPTAGGNDTRVQFNNVPSVLGSCTFLLNSHPGNLSTSYLSTVAGTTTFGPDVLVTGRGRVFGSFINDGTFDASGENNVVELLSSPKTNNGLMRAADSGILRINSAVTQPVTGVIRADAGTVETGSVTITGGTIEAINGGIVAVIAGNTTTYDGVTSLGNIRVPNASILNVISTDWECNAVVTVNDTSGGNDTRVQFNNAGNVLGDCNFFLNSHPGNLNTAYLTTAAGVITHADTVSITGRGAVFGSQVFNGILAPGSDADQTDRISVNGSFTLTGDARTNIQLGGIGADDYDRLLGSGTFTLAGTLNLTLIDGFDPLPGDVFDIVATGARVGEFNTLNIPEFAGKRLAVIYLANGVRIRCVCSADWDNNGVLNSADVGAFITAYFSDLVNGTTNADFDGNGVTTSADVGAFLTVYFQQVTVCNG